MSIKISFARLLSKVLVFAVPSAALSVHAQTPAPAARAIVLQATYIPDAVRNTPLRGSVHVFADTGSTLTFTLAVQPTHGVVTLETGSTGQWSYTPSPEFTGYDEFRILVAADGETRTQRVLVLINEPPAKRKLYVDASNGSDTNPGTEVKPFASIQAASDMTLPGDTVYIKDGTYLQTSPEAVLSIARSGSPDAWITYRAYPGAHPKLFSKDAWNVVLITGSWIRVQGLDVAGNLPNVSIEDANKVYERFASGTAARTFGPETSFAQTNGIIVRPFNQHASLGEQIYPRHVEILDNLVHDAQGGGISTMQSDYVTIQGNRIQNVAGRSLYACSGISILGSQDTDFNSPAYKMFVRNNLVVNARTFVKWAATKAMSDGNGIILDSNRNTQQKGEPYAGHYLVAGNVVSNSGGAGIQVFSTDNADVVFNTVYNNSLTPGLEYGQIWVHAASNLRIMNNIIVAGPDGKMNQSFTNNKNVVYDYNIYFGGRKPELHGLHDIMGDPMMLDAKGGNFRLATNSPAVDSGKEGFAVPRDFDGKPRQTGRAPDRGAFELR